MARELRIPFFQKSAAVCALTNFPALRRNNRGLLQKCYGIAKDRAERELDDFINAMKP
jgi:hypothetical protein